MKKIHLIQTGIYALLLVSACRDAGDCFHGTGTETSEFRAVSAFNSINLSGNINLNFHQDSAAAVKVTAGEHLQEGIETKTENKILYISNRNRCNWVRRFNTPISVEVSAPELNLLFIEDATGNVTFDDTLRGKEFRLDSYSGMGSYELLLDVESAILAIHTGPSDLKVAGRAGYAINYQAGYGKNDCLSLRTDHTVAVNKSTNDLKVQVGNRLDVELSGSGNIYFTGDPSEVNSRITGRGSLIKL